MTNTAFRPSEVIRFFRHLDSMSLLSYRDSLREANLTVNRPTRAAPGEKVLVGSSTCRLVKVMDTTRISDGTYMIPSSQELAMDHHIAVNLILKERGFTANIDNPEITIEFPQ